MQSDMMVLVYSEKLLLVFSYVAQPAV